MNRTDLRAVLDRALPALRRIDESITDRRLYPGAWTLREIVGHLIDSASNNHQRFVRLQISERLEFPDYQRDNEAWVRLQRFNRQPWSFLLQLWELFNRHLAHVIENIDSSSRTHVWLCQGRQIALAELVEGYLEHLQGHIDDIFQRADTLIGMKEVSCNENH